MHKTASDPRARGETAVKIAVMDRIATANVQCRFSRRIQPVLPANRWRWGIGSPRGLGMPRFSGAPDLSYGQIKVALPAPLISAGVIDRSRPGLLVEEC